LSIEFWARLRDEERYEDIQALVDAIEADVQRASALVPPRALS
jgi:FAD synthase